MPSPQRSVLRSVGRALVLAAKILAGIYVGYLVVANVVVSPAVVARIFYGADGLDIGADGAWTPLPFFVLAKKLRINLHDQNIQARITVENVSGWIDPRGLFHRKFRATHVRGEHASLRLRHRFDPWDVTEQAVAPLPPLLPNDDPPITPAWVDEPPILDWPSSTNWEVEVDDVDVGVHEAWIQAIRYESAGAEARARGAFDLQGGYSLWVGPASLDVPSGTVKIAEATLLSSVEGTILCTIEPFLVDDVGDFDTLRFFDVDARLRGEVASLAALRDLPPELHLRDGSGQLDVDAHTHQGVLLVGSEVSYRTDRVDGAFGDWGGIAPLTAVAKVREAKHGIDVSVDSPSIAVTSRGASVGHLRRVHALAELASADLTDPGQQKLSSVDARVGEAAVSDLRSLSRQAKELGVVIAGGAARASGELHWRPDAISSTGEVSIDSLACDAGETSLRVTSTAGFSVRESNHAFSGQVHVRGDVASDSTKLKWASDLTADVTARDFRPRSKTGELHADLAVARARLVLPSNAAATVDGLTATLSAVRNEQGEHSAEARLEAARIDLRKGSSLAQTRLVFTTKLREDKGDWVGPVDVSLRDAVMSSGARGVSGWWADIRSSVLIRPSVPVMTARVRLTLRDPSPLLAVLVTDDDIPSWLAAPVSGTVVRASATAQVGKGLLAFSIVDAREGALDLRGRATEANKKMKGAFLIRLSPTPALSAGLLLEGGKVHISPLVGASWLREHGGDSACGNPTGC